MIVAGLNPKGKDDMGEAADKLTGMLDSPGRYDIPHEDIREIQAAAMNERLQERLGCIKLLRHRADEAGLTEIRRHEDAVPLLLPHTAYKSYPESFLSDQRWDRLTKWLDTVSTHRVPAIDTASITGVDDWVNRLAGKGHFVSCSSGTTGKSAMLPASQKDMDWCTKEAVLTYSWGSGVVPAQDRHMIGMGGAALTPRNKTTGSAYFNALQDPTIERYVSPIPQMTIGNLTDMVVLRKQIADGTANPSEIQRFKEVSAERQQLVDQAVVAAAQAAISARAGKLHITGYWSGLHPVATAVREMGYSAKDFNSDNSIYCTGGLKGAQLPPDYREFVYETFNIRPDRNYLGYSMQEIQTGMPRCQKGERYHLPPWLVPLILNKEGDELLPIAKNEYEGRAAFFDLSLDGRWGGVISGDKIAIDFSPCACGHKGPSIRDDVTRYSDIQGDDKIGCAGTIDAYVRGVV